MSYKFLRITDYYGGFLKAFNEAHPELWQVDYQTHYNTLVDDSIEIVSSYGKELRRMGIDAMDVVSNANTLQARWAQENGLSASASQEEIVMQQILKFRPDVVWIDTTSLLNSSWLKMLRKQAPFMKILAGHICAPYGSLLAEAFKELDVVFTCTPCMHKELIAGGVKRSELVYHSFHPIVLEKLKERTNTFPHREVIFTGSLTTGFGLHNTRIQYLERMVNSGVDLALYGNLEPTRRIAFKKVFRSSVRLARALGIEGLISENNFYKRYKHHADADVKFYSSGLRSSVLPPVFGMDMFRALENADICFNIHGDIAGNCAGNLRLFEATGAGTCLLTDGKSNMNALFEEGKEVVTYSGLDDCMEKLNYLIRHKDEAKMIGKSGQQRALKAHSVANRVEQVNAIFAEMLKSR